MFKTILVPTDGSALSDKAVNTAIDYARSTGARLVALCVAEPYPMSPMGETGYIPDLTAYEQQAVDQARKHVDKVAQAATAAGVSCDAHTAQSFSPYEEIIRLAEKEGCDAIFIASHGRRGLNRIFLGSETQKVLAHSSIPVLVLR